MITAKKKIISLEVRDEYVLGSGVSIGAQGSFDSVVLRVKFDDSWIGLKKYATWTNAQGEVGDQTIITAIDLVDGEVDTYDIPVPGFATQYDGTITLSFTGYVLGNGGKEIDSVTNTASGAFRVLPSNATRLDGGNTAASIAEQLVADMDALEEDMNALNDDMDALQASEILRFDAENARETAEEERKTTELARDVAEEERKASETERVENENARELAELQRAQAEDERIANELARQAVMGDLNAALDGIIAIQKELMGGNV